MTIQVANDIAGSGYSETRAGNWLGRPTGSCHGTYRYLSHTTVDGSRRGKAIFRPAHIARYAAGAFGDGSALGHVHLEVLDKDMHGASWRGQDYQPRADRVDAGVVGAMEGFVATPPDLCGDADPVRPLPDPPADDPAVDDPADEPAGGGDPRQGASDEGGPDVGGPEDAPGAQPELDVDGGDPADTLDEADEDSGAGHVGFCATQPGRTTTGNPWWKRLLRR